MHLDRVAGRRSSSLLRRISVILVLLPVLLFGGAHGQESTIEVQQEMRRMMNSNSSSSSMSPTAAKAKALRVPGLPDLPDTNASLQSIQEDAAAAIRALRNAIDYNGKKRKPSKVPVWRPGVSSHGGAAFVATTAAATARADGGGGAKASSTREIPEGIVVEEFEVLSEERERVVGGQRSRERLWVPLTVARPAASSSGNGSEEASSSSPPSSYPALFLLHSTAGSRAKTRARLLRAAERGYVALAPEFRYFGTRGVLWETFSCGAGEPEAGSSAKEGGRDCNDAAAAPADFDLYESELVRSFRSNGAEERPFLLDNCWDLQRVLDWLFFVGADEEEEKPEPEGKRGGGGGDGGSGDDERRRRQQQKKKKLFNIDASRVGTTGISLGGMHSVLFGVLEQDRIAAMAPAIGVTTFAWGAAHGDQWEPRAASIPKVFAVAAREETGSEKEKPTAEVYVKVLNAIAPGLLGPYDASRALAAIAPRPLLIANGAADGRNPLGGVGQGVNRALKVYESQNKSGNLEYFLDEVAGHEYTPALEEKVDTWLDGWLLRK